MFEEMNASYPIGFMVLLRSVRWEFNSSLQLADLSDFIGCFIFRVHLLNSCRISWVINFLLYMRPDYEQIAMVNFHFYLAQKELLQVVWTMVKTSFYYLKVDYEKTIHGHARSVGGVYKFLATSLGGHCGNQNWA